MLPVMHQACAETTGALWSSRTMMTRPLSKVVIRVPAGEAGISTGNPCRAARSRGTVDGGIKIKDANPSDLVLCPGKAERGIYSASRACHRAGRTQVRAPIRRDTTLGRRQAQACFVSATGAASLPDGR